MTNFETLLPFLVGALVLLTGAVIFLCARVERRLADRKRISLANYKEKNGLFYILNDIPTAVIAGAAALLTLILLVLCLANPVIRIYAIVLGVLLPVDGAAVYLSLSRKKCNRDIRLFDAYYVQVEHVLARKDRTLADITVCQNRVNDLRDRLTQTIQAFNQNLARGLSGAFLPALFAPVDDMIRDYIGEIEQFAAEVERNFDAALQEFLLNETVPEFHSVPLRSFDESEVDALLTAIKSSYGDRIAVMVVDEVNRGAVKNAKALGNIMTLFHKLEVEMDKETLALFLESASRFDDRGEFAVLLYRNRQISARMVRETFIPQNWEWIFTPVMAEAYNRKELTAILTDLLAADRREMCHRLLTGFDAALLDVLDGALAAETARSERENSACRLAKAHRLILSRSYAVGNSGNMFENMGYMLYDRREELGFAPDVQERIAAIVREDRFYAARQEILVYFEQARSRLSPMVASATRVLLLYITEGAEGFLDAGRLASLLCEYRETLSLGDLATMRALLAAWLLVKSKDNATLAAVLRELKKQSPVPLPEGEIKDAAAVGKALLAYLTKNDRVRLRSVIYRTESDRRMLDSVLQL